MRTDFDKVDEFCLLALESSSFIDDLLFAISTVGLFFHGVDQVYCNCSYFFLEVNGLFLSD